MNFFVKSLDFGKSLRTSFGQKSLLLLKISDPLEYNGKYRVEVTLGDFFFHAKGAQDMAPYAFLDVGGGVGDFGCGGGGNILK